MGFNSGFKGLTLIPNVLTTGNILYILGRGQRWQLTGKLFTKIYVR